MKNGCSLFVRLVALACIQSGAMTTASTARAGADDDATVRPGAEPFYFKGGPVGCLLIHGFPGSPAEMRQLGQYLATNGITVSGIRLPGFGTTPSDLRQKNWEDWCEAGREGLAALQRECTNVFVVGFSTGGLVALYLAATNPVAGVVSLSTFISPRNRLANAGRLPVLRKLVPALLRYVPTGSAFKSHPTAGTETNEVSYSYVPLRTGVEVLELAQVVKGLLPSVAEPILILQSKNDAVVSESSVTCIRDHVQSADRTVLWLESSGHVITLGPEKQKVFDAVLAFVRRVAGP